MKTKEAIFRTPVDHFRDNHTKRITAPCSAELFERYTTHIGALGHGSKQSILRVLISDFIDLLECFPPSERKVFLLSYMQRDFTFGEIYQKMQKSRESQSGRK